MLKGIKVVFLDVDNTLLDFNACSRLSMQKAFEECGLPFEETMYATFKQVNDSLWHKIEQGTITRAELLQQRWPMILKQLGFDADGEMVETRYGKHMSQESVPIEGAYGLLEYLNSRYTVCVASNAPYELQIKRLESVHMLPFFHKIFVSETVGTPKPGKAFFDACFRELPGIAPQETVLIGDSVTADIRGGRAYGMYTCWYDYAHSGSPCEEADFSVTSLEEIRHLL